MDIRRKASDEFSLVVSMSCPLYCHELHEKSMSMEQARHRVNRFTPYKVLTCRRRMLPLPFNGVHWSKLENYPFLNNIKGALKYLVWDERSRHFLGITV